MPPPALKLSELRSENYKRGRSLDRRITIDDKEDDLALFNEVKNKERDNYLLQSNCDLDDIFSTKIRQFSDHKVGFSIATRGESSDLLNAVDKNDYDWLLTPPESPLFPSLDDERLSLHHETRGRRRSQPVPISQASKVDKGCRSVRGSPSPRRPTPSPSPRSRNAKIQARSRPSSASPSTFSHISPPRRLSPPPNKLITARSGTLTPRRMSTGSAITTRARGGTSPVNVSRGSSASPKTRSWQSNIPGFPCEAPLNLCTSLADRPGSYVRGSTPASRSSRSGRQSMSPTASRSVSSSNSHEMDPFNSYSKGTVSSSRDDDMDSLPSNPVSCSNYSVPQNICALPNNRSSGVCKKPTKVLSSSAPKRHSNFAFRQMDKKKGPHKMFRPLMSSVSSSTFYAGKGGTPSRSLVSRNSSITSSSIVISDHATSGALDVEQVDESQDEQHPGRVEGVYAMYPAETSIENVGIMITENLENDDSSAFSIELAVAESSSTALVDSVVDMDGASSMELCFRCQRRLNSSELITEGDQLLCRRCKMLESIPSFILQETAMAEASSPDISEHSTSVPEWTPIIQTGATKIDHYESIVDKGQNLAPSLTEEPELCIDGEPCHEEKLLADFYLNSKFYMHEVKGLSLLLKRSIGAQGHLIPSRSYSASNTSYDDFSYMRESLTSLRSSVGRSSVSALSSFDLGSYKSSEAHVHGQLREQDSDKENFRCGETTSHECSISMSLEDGFETITKNQSNGVRGAAHQETHEQSLNSESTEASTSTDKGSGIMCKTTDSGVWFSTSEEPSSLEKGNRNSEDPTQEETSTSKLQVCGLGGDTPMSSNCDGVDAEPKFPQLEDTISEMKIRIDDTFSHIEFDSPKSEICMNEVVGDLTVLEGDDVAAYGEQPHVSVTKNTFLEDIPRSLTLEEATDVILICSSIVHDIAYNAANIAIDKEILEAAFPITVPFPSKTISDKKEICPRTLARRRSKSHKAHKRELEMKQRSPQSVLAENEGKSTPRIVLSPASMSNSSMPPKLVSKCNCTIM